MFNIGHLSTSPILFQAARENIRSIAFEVGFFCCYIGYIFAVQNDLNWN